MQNSKILYRFNMWTYPVRLVLHVSYSTCDIICSQNSLQLLQCLQQLTLKVRIGQSHPHEECGTLDELGSVEQRLIRENGEESWTKKRQPELIPQRDVGIRVGMPEPKAQKYIMTNGR